VGAPAALIARQRAYLLRYIGRLQALVGAHGSLDDSVRAALTEEMRKALPGAGLEFLVGMSADAVLSELRLVRH
jgi:hypothetical protein